jgi:hypothetical protein
VLPVPVLELVEPEEVPVDDEPASCETVKVQCEFEAQVAPCPAHLQLESMVHQPS